MRRAERPTWREALDAFKVWKDARASYTEDEQRVFEAARAGDLDEYSATPFAAGYLAALSRPAPTPRSAAKKAKRKK